MRLALIRQSAIASVWRTRREITDKGAGCRELHIGRLPCVRCNRTGIPVRTRTLAPAAVVLHADDLQRWAALLREARELPSVLSQLLVFRQVSMMPRLSAIYP